MAYTQADIDALKEAIATGAMTVEIEGKRVTYRSLSEMRQILRDMTTEVAAATGIRPIRRVRINAEKGL